MSALVTILFFVVAVLLIAIVLIQQPKTSGGLFSGTGQSLLGTSGKTFWTKFTATVAAVFMGLCLLMAALPKFQSKSDIADSIEKQQAQQAAPQAQAPAAPAATQVAPAAQPKPASSDAPKSAPAPVGKPKK
jgi:preprotein translocase subunit SecG